MLINRGVTSGEVITLKLSSGEELVARLDEETATHYNLTKPMVIAAGPNGLGLLPYMFTVSKDQSISLSKTNVNVMVATDKVFADQYLESTTSIRMA
jgi:hypothetical protein